MNPLSHNQGSMSYSALAAQMIAETQKQAPKEVRKDIVAAPIEAWRIWVVNRDEHLVLGPKLARQMADQFDQGRNPFRDLFGARLSGVGVPARWEAGDYTATCQKHHLATMQLWYQSGPVAPRHPAPRQDCSCGVWAVKDENTIHTLLASYSGQTLAYGRVQMWGRIYEHEKGYRAEHARPVDINVIGGDAATVDELAGFYGCPVRAVAMPDRVVETIAARQRQAHDDAMKHMTAHLQASSQAVSQMKMQNQIYSATLGFGAMNVPSVRMTRRRGNGWVTAVATAAAVFDAALAVVHITTSASPTFIAVNATGAACSACVAWRFRPRTEEVA